MNKLTASKIVVTALFVGASVFSMAPNASAYKMYEFQVTDTRIDVRPISTGATVLLFQNNSSSPQTLSIDNPNAAPASLCSSTQSSSCSPTNSWTIPSGMWLRTSLFTAGQATNVTAISDVRTLTTTISASDWRVHSSPNNQRASILLAQDATRLGEQPAMWASLLVITNTIWLLGWMRKRHRLRTAATA